MKRMGHFMGAVAVVQASFAGALFAQENPVVIELFTSQGCSSCPPADAILHEMAKSAEVLALAYHVDYWDYLGWQDNLADPAFTQRQKAYAHAVGEKMIYTPQAIVNGRARLVGSDAQAVMSAVMHEANNAPSARVSAQRNGDTLQILGTATDGFSGPAEVVLVRYLPNVTVDILHGENAGQSITYVNTVTSLTVLGEWSGLEPLEISAPIRGADAAAILLQAAEMGSVLGAAMVK